MSVSLFCFFMRQYWECVNVELIRNVGGMTKSNSFAYRMIVGNREYVPVVRISTAAGIWKLGRQACTNVSRAIRTNESAVSTNNSDCLSKKSIMCCANSIEKNRKYNSLRMTYACGGRMQCLPMIYPLWMRSLPISPKPVSE